MVANNHEYMMSPIRETIRRACPTINLAGQSALDGALDDNLQAALTGGMGVEEALKKTEQAWKKIIGKREKETVAAIRSQRSAWPTVWIWVPAAWRSTKYTATVPRTATTRLAITTSSIRASSRRCRSSTVVSRVSSSPSRLMR